MDPAVLLRSTLNPKPPRNSRVSSALRLALLAFWIRVQGSGFRVQGSGFRV